MFRFVLALGVLAGCASPAALDAPAPRSAPSAAGTVSLAALAPAPQPDLPPALRPSPTPAMSHGAMSHGAMDHGAMPAPALTPLAEALDAYLAVQEALAADATAPDATRAFLDAWARAIETAPEADPHFWHLRAEPVAAVREAALDLAEADDLADARRAFGHLSAPFVALIEAHGAPEGYALARFTCGMRSALPEGGVWLQRGTEARNPYFGTQMLACATDEAAVPSRTGDLPTMEGMRHEAHSSANHAGHDG